MQSHFDQRTVISYLAEKVRHYDAAGCVAVETIGGQEALCLYEEIEEETYCTQIYVYDGMLMELFAEAGADLPPESGEAILAISDLQLELDGSLLQIECTGTDGETAELQLCLRAEGQVA